MKKQSLLLLALMVTLSGFAQRTNRTHRGRTHPTEQQRKSYQERRFNFMDKALSRIGVSNEDRILIRKLQEKHRLKMKANAERSAAARKKLSKLQEQDASIEELDAAIDQVAKAMAEQLKILARNRKAMEKILGKEKYALFMKTARVQFQRHGRHGGSTLPPRPNLPPAPPSSCTPPVPAPPLPPSK